MFVKMCLRTNRVGCDFDEVYEVDDNYTDEELTEVAHDLARDNAEMYGIFDDDGDFEDEGNYWGYWERLEGTREEIEEEYGEINNSW